jgi:putative Holliday junction resolvase
MRRIGVDPGSRRTGLAFAEPDVRVAYPLKTVEHKGIRQAAAMVADEVRLTKAEEIVVGLPLRIDGTEGEAARRVREFVGLVEAETKLPVVLWDERLSTVEVERHLSRAQVFGKKRRKVVDQAAATLILQSYLDSIGESVWVEEINQQVEPSGKATRRRRGGGERGKRRRERQKKF